MNNQELFKFRFYNTSFNLAMTWAWEKPPIKFVPSCVFIPRLSKQKEWTVFEPSNACNVIDSQFHTHTMASHSSSRIISQS